MSNSILIAGIGNIFQGDDAFGVEVARRLASRLGPAEASLPLGGAVRILETGIRGIDLCFALLDPYELTILIDATQRGGEPGALYTIEIDPREIPDGAGACELPNSHGLDPVCVLALAKSMGARFGSILLVGCEPLVLDCDDTGRIGLSEAVQAAVDPAVDLVQELIEEFRNKRKEEVCVYEIS